jgi:heme exporter protein A
VKAIVLKEVSKRYGAHWALRKLTREIDAGALVLLTGHNGSGKTTLLRLLCSALQPSRGRAEIFGVDIAKDPEAVRAKTALVSHASHLYEELTARENLSLVARALNKGGVQEALARVGLQTRADERVRQFSAGMRKRLSLARALLKNPPLILLDEPLGELDPDGMALVEALIGEWHRAGSTVVMSTHWIEQGERLATERLHLENGSAT